ncbi:hypothetical protein [Streptomyces sp. AS02]|uniref:hypothetical protein n=1 Tax=Streptomyces sp. AS02 TaxID=2938946 RepID=UPI00201FDF8F|nr:hypothetical protein [Streptomyces sp. AS02]MCL8016902.1 hypothetical protein [Streptomyces sp. AS02]
MTNLPQGWTLTEPDDEYGPHVLRQDGTALAAVRLRANLQMRDAVVGSWEWYSLSGAGDDVWYEERGFHDFDDAVAAAIGKVSKAELWTIADVTEFLGAASTGSARKTLSRWGVTAVGRQPGRAGASLYDPNQVRDARAAAPGQGARTDRTA